ncbi:MAG TPA: bifunctional diaminohydroxyphosphoribosylaminopyrimidine deaminase/5-amino-6-(5-phosphoribosylamino)uracil reductase RibD, partial [Candidatus Omnitrophota bacterium]|nr:bifunctional diaminohydroxyphosphoribosylaminopyrimidine deaminase/5-amino-6-(5-phosphoribosylamino)uracil reductase RibD [Candidatus Omnitrophota bacterium]
IIKSGIKKVYVAMKDPNPINSGRGIARLRSSGIKVDLGIMGTEAQFINRAYVKFIKKGLPYITVKTAQSIDGKTAAFNGTSKWISSYRSRMYVRKLRALADAVMVGIGTVLKDDPLLLPSKSSGKKTIRVVLDSRLRIPEKARIIKTAGTGPVVVVTTRAASADKIKRLSARKGVKVMVVKSRNGKVDLGDFLHKITREGVLSIISESGGTLAGGLFDGGFVDEMIFFIAPKILGGTNVSIAGRGVADISEAVELERAEVFSSAGDLVIRATLKKSRDKGATVCLRA